MLLQRQLWTDSLLTVDLNAPTRTDHLLLRPVGQDDLPALTELKTDPEVARYLPYSTLPSPDEVALALGAEMELVSSTNDTLVLGIQRHGDPELIGQVAIWPRKTGDVPRGELIVLVSPSHWRHGVASEACAAVITRWLSNFDGSTVYAAVHPENLACQALMRKVGLDHEIDGGGFPGIHAETDRVFWSQC